MAALATIIAGRYSATYTVPSGAATDIGITNDPGYKLSFTPSWELIDKTDAYADNVIEMIWLGLSQVSVDFICKEVKTQTMAMATQFGAYSNAAPPVAQASLPATGAAYFASGLVGRRGTDLAGALILSSTTGTPAVATPASMTFTHAALHEGNNIDLVFGPRHRTVPIKFRIIGNNTAAAAAQVSPVYFAVT